VEGTLAIMILIFLIVATVDLAQVMLFMQNFSERSREGARWATVHNYDTVKIKNYVAYGSPTAPTNPDAKGLLGLMPSHVTVNRFDANTEQDRIEVTISSFTLRMYTPLISKIYTPRPFKTVIPVESLGATN